MIKVFVILCIICNFIYAEDEHKVQALELVKSEFVPQIDTLTVTSVNQVALPVALEIGINNQWQFTLKSKTPIIISKIALEIDDTVIANQVNLELKPDVPVHYFFSDVKLQQVMQSISRGYKFIGVYKLLTADEVIGFSDYKYKKLNVTMSWTDSKDYNQSTKNFILEFAR